MAATAVGLVESTPTVTARIYRLPPHVRRRRATYERNRRARIREVGGPLEIDAGPTRSLIAALLKEGWRPIDVARAVGMSKSAFHHFWRRIREGGDHVVIYRTTAERFAEVWAEAHPPELNLDPEPLVEHIRRRHGSVRAAGVSAQMAVLRREYAAGKGLTRRQADRWARRFGALEWEIWPELMP